MAGERPGLDAVEAAVVDDTALRTPGRISNENAMVRGVERFDHVDLDEEWLSWAKENSPMTSYSIYGFDADGRWSCVFVNEFSGEEPVSVSPWRRATEGHVGEGDHPHDPEQVARYIAHGFRPVPKDDLDAKVVDCLRAASSNVPWNAEEYGDGPATRDEALAFLTSRME